MATGLLGDAEIDEALAGLTGWERDGDAIAREWRLADFRAAIGFVERVAEIAEERNHHPDILVHGYNRVRLSVTSHSAGGLTAADFALAARVDALG